MCEKTGKPYQVAILSIAQEIIDRYRSHPLCVKKNRVLPVVSNTKYNGYLKEIADIVGIKKHLTTHIARKTFATTIMLTNGVNIGILSRLLGHASVNITLEAYGTFNDQLLLSHVDMIRKKLISKDDDMKIQDPKENSANED